MVRESPANLRWLRSLACAGAVMIAALVGGGCDDGAAGATADDTLQALDAEADLGLDGAREADLRRLGADLPGGDLRPGDLFLDYVTDQRYPSLLIEVDAVGDALRPSTFGALTRLRHILERRLMKPVGIDFAPGLIDTAIPAAEAQDVYDARAIEALEQRHRANRTGDLKNPHRAVIWIVYLNGRSEHDDDAAEALGLAVGASQIAVFPEQIDAALDGATPDSREREIAEALVLLHEVGHLLGLVNNGAPQVTDHEDLVHPFHCQDPGCVMHYRIEDGWLEAGAPLDLGYGCRLDLFAVGGRDPGPPDEPVTYLGRE